MSTCNKMIEGNIVSFACSVDTPEGPNHDGPCATPENERSMRARKRWEEEQRNAASGLGEFQGPALTTAQSLTEGATDTPGPTSSRGPSDGPPEPSPDEDDPHYFGDSCPGGHFEEYQEMLAKAEGPVVLSERTDGSTEFRPATTAEAKVAGIAPQGEPPLPDDPTMPDLEPTKQRPGDQPLPTVTEGEESVQDRIIAKTERLVENGSMSEDQARLIVARMEESKRIGTERYGTPLQTFNGRDTLRDAAEEARDQFVYLESMLQAREASRERLVEVGAQALREAGFDDHFPNVDVLVDIALGAILDATGGLE